MNESQQDDKGTMIDAIINSALVRLKPWFDDPDVQQITVMNHANVFCDYADGTCRPVKTGWKDNNELSIIVGALPRYCKQSIDYEHPIMDAYFGRTRLTVLIDPVFTGIYIAIRKQPETFYTLDQLQEFGAFDTAGRELLDSICRNNHKTLFAGSVSSGKTTLLTAMLNHMPEKYRVVSIEDTPEIRLERFDSTQMLTKKALYADDTEVNAQQLVKTALRMNPSTISVGEIRDAEGNAFVHALSTGNGGMASIHADSAEAAIDVLAETMFMAGGNLTDERCFRKIARAIQYICHLKRDPETGRRFLNEVIQIVGYKRTDGIQTKKIYPKE